MVSKFATVSRIALFAGALALSGGAALAQTTAAPAPTTSTTTAAPAPTTAAPAMTQAAPAAAPKVEAGKNDQKPATATAGAAKPGAAVSQDKKVEKHSSILHRSQPRHQHIVKTSAEKVDGSAAAKTGDVKTAPATTAGQKAEAGKTDAKPGAVDAGKKADGKSSLDKAPASEGSSTATKKL